MKGMKYEFGVRGRIQSPTAAEGLRTFLSFSPTDPKIFSQPQHSLYYSEHTNETPYLQPDYPVLLGIANYPS